MNRILGLAVASFALLMSAAPAAASAPLQDADTTFLHANHRDFGCFDCHSMQADHGELLVRSTADCRGCHHTGDRLARGCASCHAEAEVADLVVPVQRSFALTVQPGPSVRDIAFAHAVHAERECVECHVGEPTLSAQAVDCRSCHEEHHESPGGGCWTCHVRPPPEAHTLEVHTTCSGAGCHVDSPIQSPPRSRDGCLMCHEEQSDHEPDGACADCHFVNGVPVESSHADL